MRLQFRFGLMLAFALVPIEATLAAILAFQLWDPETPQIASPLLILGGMFAAGVLVPIGISFFASASPKLVFNRNRDEGVLAVSNQSERVFQLSKVQSVEIREVIQTGPQNGEDSFPRQAVQLSLLLDKPPERLRIVESIDEVNVRMVANEMAEFIGVPVEYFSGRNFGHRKSTIRCGMSAFEMTRLCLRHL